MHDAVSMQRIKHCVNPHGQSLRVIFTVVKDTEAFQFTRVAVSASEINLRFIKYWKNLSLAQIIMIKLSDNSSAAMVTKCQCAWGWGLLQDRSMRRSVITAQHLNLRAQNLLIYQVSQVYLPSLNTLFRRGSRCLHAPHAFQRASSYHFAPPTTLQEPAKVEPALSSL